MADGTTQNVTSLSAWLSSNGTVATVTPGGVVFAVAAGTADISATYRGVVGSTRITIFDPNPGVDAFTRNYIQSLFLGSGPLTPAEGTHGCGRRGVWIGYPRGTHVRVRTSATVRQDIVSALATAAEQVPGASGGAISASIEPTPEDNPLPSANEVTVTMHANPQSLGCTLSQGCTMFTFSGSNLVSARSILVTTQPAPAYVHDAIGHGVLGLCHVDGNLIGGPRLSLMSFGVGVFSNNLPVQLSAFDLAAAHPVFGSGLAIGSSIQDFIRAGLVVAPVSTGYNVPRSHPFGRDTFVIDSPPIR